jgi:hypothetical protein
MLTRSSIKIPKLIRSVFAAGIIFLLIMSLLRIALYFSFSRQGHHFTGVLPFFARTEIRWKIHLHIVVAAIDCGEFPISGSHAKYCRQEIGVVSQWRGSFPCRIFLFCGFFDNTAFHLVGDHGIPGDASNMFPRAWTDQRITNGACSLTGLCSETAGAPKLLAPTRNPAICSQGCIAHPGRPVQYSLPYADRGNL